VREDHFRQTGHVPGERDRPAAIHRAHHDRPPAIGVRSWLLRQGLVEGRDFVIRRYREATHNEASWRARLDDPLTFLFGNRVP
jgi:hypothetical protein